MFEGKIQYNNDVVNSFSENFKQLIVDYKRIKKEAVESYTFLYEALNWSGNFTIRRFISFLTILRKPTEWHS